MSAYCTYLWKRAFYLEMCWFQKEERLAVEEAVLKGSNEPDLEIFETEVMGRGIRTLRSFNKNEFVVEYKGEVYLIASFFLISKLESQNNAQ